MQKPRRPRSASPEKGSPAKASPEKRRRYHSPPPAPKLQMRPGDEVTDALGGPRSISPIQRLLEPAFNDWLDSFHADPRRSTARAAEVMRTDARALHHYRQGRARFPETKVAGWGRYLGPEEKEAVINLVLLANTSGRVLSLVPGFEKRAVARVVARLAAITKSRRAKLAADSR